MRLTVSTMRPGSTVRTRTVCLPLARENVAWKRPSRPTATTFDLLPIVTRTVAGKPLVGLVMRPRTVGVLSLVLLNGREIAMCGINAFCAGPASAAMPLAVCAPEAAQENAANPFFGTVRE